MAPRADARLSVDALTDVLRHELVHVLTGPVLDDAPAWVAEGLATEVESGPNTTRRRRSPRPVAGPCPSDALVVRPGSLEAMRDAYARAGACVSAALPAGPRPGGPLCADCRLGLGYWATDRLRLSHEP